MIPKIAKEGWPFIFIFALSAFLGGKIHKILGRLLWGLTLFSLYFFRDPKRSIPSEPNLLVSPADGKVVGISEVFEKHYLKKDAVNVSIFLSIFDVHINRIPGAGRVKFLKYIPGQFLAAFDPKASLKNEQNLVGVEMEGGLKYLVKQIAGLIARRIICYKVPGHSVERGEKLGLIRFGSRTDLMVPKDSIKKILVKMGDRIKGGETPVFEIN